jgi:hypothetical protein
MGEGCIDTVIANYFTPLFIESVSFCNSSVIKSATLSLDSDKRMVLSSKLRPPAKFSEAETSRKLHRLKNM